MSQEKLGDQLKEQAIDRVMQANDIWISRAIRAVRWLCDNKKEFTTDAVWGVCERTNIGRPGEPRAMGALMTLAKEKGWIRATDEWQKSKRPECHSRPLKVWEVVK